MLILARKLTNNVQTQTLFYNKHTLLHNVLAQTVLSFASSTGAGTIEVGDLWFYAGCERAHSCACDYNIYVFWNLEEHKLLLMWMLRN